MIRLLGQGSNVEVVRRVSHVARPDLLGLVIEISRIPFDDHSGLWPDDGMPVRSCSQKARLATPRQVHPVFQGLERIPLCHSLSPWRAD